MDSTPSRPVLVRFILFLLKTAGPLALIVGGLFLGLELLARQESLTGGLPVPSVGTGHRELDYKLVMIDRMVSREGAPDCLFLGSSAMYRAVDPEVFNEAFRKDLGRPVSSFNFGLKGLVLEGSSPMARVLVEDYQPRLLVAGVSPAALGLEAGTRSSRLIQDNPWVQYRLGRFNLDGWLTDHFRSYRYYLGYLYGRQEKIRFTEERVQKYIKGVTRYGYGLRDADIQRRDPNSSLWTFRPLGSVSWSLQDYRIREDNVRALEGLLELKRQVQIVLLEMPVHPGTLSYFQNGQQDYDRGMRVITDLAEKTGVPLWRTMPFDQVDDSGWLNANHMNLKGSRIFSRWLGNRTAAAVRNREIPDPAR